MTYRFAFIFFVSTSLFAQNDTIDTTRFNIQVEEISSIIHYSGYYKGLRSNGHIVSDTNGNIVSKSMYCASFEDSTIFYYRLTRYFPNQEIKYDSILDFTNKRTAHTIVICKSCTGKTKYSIKLKAKLNPKHNDIPIRSETLWYGRELFFNEHGEKTLNRIKGETR